MDERLTPLERIRRKRDFEALYRSGRRYRGRYFHLVYQANALEFPRIGVVVSRKVGNAVERNRIKRRVRTLFRRNKALFRKPTDVILIARPDLAGLSWTELAGLYRSAVEGIFRERAGG
jgi:ribonuclease P protein component